jgi:hypothetical protein
MSKKRFWCASPFYVAPYVGNHRNVTIPNSIDPKPTPVAYLVTLQSHGKIYTELAFKVSDIVMYGDTSILKYEPLYTHPSSTL